jgi:hypothetical protein
MDPRTPLSLFKTGGGIWKSEKVLIDRWRREQTEVDKRSTEEPQLSTSEAAAYLGSIDT